jgi:hypothetical protein
MNACLTVTRDLVPDYGRLKTSRRRIKMGKATGDRIDTIYNTGSGSDRYGDCELCGQHCSEHHVWQRNRVYVNDKGERYLAPTGGGAFGHKECLLSQLGPAIDRHTLPNDGRLRYLHSIMETPAQTSEKAA